MCKENNYIAKDLLHMVIFEIITTAWEALSDKLSREVYDVGAGLFRLPRKQQESSKVESKTLELLERKDVHPIEDMSRRNRAKRVT